MLVPCGGRAPGNAEFVNGNYTDAIHLYTKAIEANPHDERLYSNRSASYLKLRRFALALQDAQVRGAAGRRCGRCGRCGRSPVCALP